jgi:hypothetical protein
LFGWKSGRRARNTKFILRWLRAFSLSDGMRRSSNLGPREEQLPHCFRMLCSLASFFYSRRIYFFPRSARDDLCVCILRRIRGIFSKNAHRAACLGPFLSHLPPPEVLFSRLASRELSRRAQLARESRRTRGSRSSLRLRATALAEY